jgi:hypothetical protein
MRKAKTFIPLDINNELVQLNFVNNDIGLQIFEIRQASLGIIFFQKLISCPPLIPDIPWMLFTHLYIHICPALLRVTIL